MTYIADDIAGDAPAGRGRQTNEAVVVPTSDYPCSVRVGRMAVRPFVAPQRVRACPHPTTATATLHAQTVTRNGSMARAWQRGRLRSAAYRFRKWSSPARASWNAFKSSPRRPPATSPGRARRHLERALSACHRAASGASVMQNRPMFGAMVRARRIEAGLTPEELAEQTSLGAHHREHRMRHGPPAPSALRRATR